jgi:CheY-like chemotaxis protein
MKSGNLQILVVEDEYDSVQMVSKILDHHGIQVTVVHNGIEAMEIVEGLQPDLVIMDLAMPEMDGWETLVAMRANTATAHIPVVAITAYNSIDVAADARSAGFDAYFPKPVDPLTFVDNLVALID